MQFCTFLLTDTQPAIIASTGSASYENWLHVAISTHNCMFIHCYIIKLLQTSHRRKEL